MTDKILLNEEIFIVTESDLPCLITYAEKSGGSHFSVTMTANLFLSGSKILFLTAYPMAKDNFLKQIGSDYSKVALITSAEELEGAESAQAIILENGREDLFLQASRTLNDLKERVVLVKNMEVFSNAAFDICMDLEKVILSGNIDTWAAGTRAAQKTYKTIIAFTEPEIRLPIEVPALEKYTGYLSGKDRKGLVKVQMATA